MNMRSLFLFGPVVLGAILGLSSIKASAARLPTSTITVNVLSVDRESVNREEIRYPGQPSVAFEKSNFVAKAKIANVVRTDHGLTPGAVIDIHYSVTVRDPPAPAFHVRSSLSAGEMATITVSGGGGSFVWQN